MKKIVLLHTFLFLLSYSFAQAPQGISYQAVAFDSGGNPISNGMVGVKVSILDNSTTGTVIYAEVHTKTTNAQGLFNLNIGQGSPTNNLFSAINWGKNDKFLKVEIDPTGGTNYTSVGTNQLMSVPYALFADEVNLDNVPIPKSAASLNGTMIVVYTSTSAYGFAQNSSGTPTWYTRSLSGTPIGAFATENSVVVYTSTNAYGFMNNNSGTPTWVSRSLSGTPLGISASGNQIVVYTSTSAYGFAASSSGTPSWYPRSLSGTPMGTVVNGYNVNVVYTSTTAYGFAQNSSGTPTWYSRSLSGTPVGGSASGELIVVYTSTSAYGFTKNNSGTPSWYLRSLSGTPQGIVPE